MFNAGADGKSPQKAFGIAEAARRTGDTLWVWGYVVGGDLTNNGIAFEGPFQKNSNLALAASATERERSRCFPVELSRAAVRSRLNLVDNPLNLGRKLFLYGVSATYFGLPGLKNVSDFQWEEE